MSLRRILVALASLFIVLGVVLIKSFLLRATSSADTVARTIGSPADISILAQIDTAEAANKDHEYELAILAIKEAATGEIYNQLSPGMKYRVDLAYGWPALQLGFDADAHRAYVRATSYFGADTNTWVMRLHTARLDNDFGDTYAAFGVLRTAIPHEQLPLNDGNVHGLEQGFGTLSGDEQYEFEQYLESMRWEPVDAFFSRDVIWYHFAQNLLAAGEKKKAFEVAARISDPDVLAVMYADKRFDEVTNPANATSRINDAAVQLLERTRAMLAKDPKWIEAHSALASRFEFLGQPEAALTEIDKALADAAQLSIPDRRHYGFDAQYDYALVVKAYALFQLGRFDEALAIASTIGAGGRQHRPNTDTALLMGTWLVALERGAEALAILSPMTGDYLNLEGRADLAALRACAAAQTGDTALLQDNLRYLRTAKLNRPGALVKALLCANDLNGAEGAVIAALDDFRQRGLMLDELQIYRIPNVVPSGNRKLEQRRAELRIRPALSAAVNRVGRINRYDIVNLGPLY